MGKKIEMYSDAEIRSTKERRKSMMCIRPTQSTAEMKTHIIRYKLYLFGRNTSCSKMTLNNVNLGAKKDSLTCHLRPCQSDHWLQM